MITSATFTDLLFLLADFMDKKTLSRIYEFTGVYDIVLSIPLIIAPVIVLGIFGVDVDRTSPFLYVTGSGLFAIGVILVYYAARAASHKIIGYCSLFVRWHYTTMITFTLGMTTYPPLFLVLAVTDFLTGILLLVALVKVK